MLEALEKVAGKQATDLVQWQEDKMIQRIVQSWPVQVKAEYAESLGFKQMRILKASFRHI